MNPKDKKCIWEYCNDECKCSECENCSKYKPGYANTKKQIIDFKEQGKPLKYLINYMLSMEQYDEIDVFNMMIRLDYDESEIIETLEYDFAIDMSEYKESK